jgi:hypothetical protein
MLLYKYQLGSQKENHVIACSEKIRKKVIESDQMHKGITATLEVFTDHKDEFR